MDTAVRGIGVSMIKYGLCVLHAYMFNPLDFIFKKRISSVLGIDIGTASIKIAELKREGEGKFRLVNYAVLEMGLSVDASERRGLSFDLQDEDLAKKIKLLRAEAGFVADAAVMSLPVFSTFVTVMTMPPLSEKELAGAIPLQAREYIPIPISEVVLDWKIIRTTTKADMTRADIAPGAVRQSVPGFQEVAGGAGGESEPARDASHKTLGTEVLLMAAPQEMVQKYVRIAQASGLTMLGLEIESFALARAVPSDAKEPALLLDIGAVSSSIAIFDEGFLRVVHNLNISSNDFTHAATRALGTDAARAAYHKEHYGLYASGGETEIATAYLPMLEALSRDIERVTSAYWRNTRRQVAEIVLSGGGSALKGLDRYLASRTRIPTHAVNPFSRLLPPKDIIPALPVLAPSLANAIGLAMKEI